MIGSLINGQACDQISILDRGLQFGDGLFETLAVLDGQPCIWNAHMRRLERGCRHLRISPIDPALLLNEARSLIGDVQQAILKIVVTRGSSERGYQSSQNTEPTRILSLYHWDGPSSEAVKIGVSSRRLGHNPDLAGVKHLNRLEQVLARAECAVDVQDEIMRDYQGQVIECIMHNLFLQQGDQLLTPAVDQCGIAGVARDVVLSLARARGIDVRVARFTLDDLFASDALYLTNSLSGVRYVSTIGDYQWQPGRPVHPLMAEASSRVFSRHV